MRSGENSLLISASLRQVQFSQAGFNEIFLLLERESDWKYSGKSDVLFLTEIQINDIVRVVHT